MTKKLFFFFLLSFPCLVAQSVNQIDLSENDFKDLIFFMKNEIKERNSSISTVPAILTKEELLQRINDGLIDPLLLLKQSSPYTLYPDSAVYLYDASCYLTELAGEPSAVFSFGLNASDYSRKVAEKTRMPEQKFLNSLFNKEDHKKVLKKINSSINFYKTHGFVDNIDYYSPDNSVKVKIDETSLYIFQNYPHIYSGPIIILSLTDFNNFSDNNIFGYSDSFVTLLKSRGYTVKEYNTLKDQLIFTLIDYGDNKLLKYEDKVPKTIEEQYLFYNENKLNRLRKNNLLLFKKYESVLIPLLEELGYPAHRPD